jgi:membrane fusion protein, copper/silver efflux system
MGFSRHLRPAAPAVSLRPAPTRRGLRRRLAWGILLFAVLGAVPACRRGAAVNATEAAAWGYYCPMHPSYISEKPGDCSICGMKLVARPSRSRRRGPATPQAMRSPFETAGDSIGASDGAVSPPALGFADEDALHGAERIVTGRITPGRATVTIPADRRQVLGVRSEPIRSMRLFRRLRTVGRVAVDEKRVARVHAKVEGYVDEVFGGFPGQTVRKGDPLLSIYSPELVQTQQDYLRAYRAGKSSTPGGDAPPTEAGADRLEGLRQRLLFWEMRPDQIAALEQTGQVRRAVDLRSGQGGVVVERTAYPGMRVSPADTLYEIADYSRVWILADLYETDLPLIRVGMEGVLTVVYQRGKSWRGFVTDVSPVVESKARTIRVRVEMDNPGGMLKPNMFGDLFLVSDLGMGLVVPETAVLQAGERRIAFVDHPDGRLEPRELRLGPRLMEGYQLISGLSEGDLVVTSANFLVDSESSLKAAVASLTTRRGIAVDPDAELTGAPRDQR